jgi:hypothetical protein
MRTTLDISDDVLAAAKEIGRRQKRTAGAVISDLARKALNAGGADVATGVRETRGAYGFKPLPKRGVVVTDALINRLRDEAGD